MSTNPATPAQAATPGNDAKVVTTPSAPVTSGSEGKVTIDLKEYRDLQRSKARTLSFEKRASFARSKPAQAANPDGTAAAQDDLRVTEAEQRASDAERRALSFEIKAGINEILNRDEFKSLPASTRALILKNPAMISDADNVEEALLDIEDFVRENAIDDPHKAGNDPKIESPGHETPRTGGASPAPVVAVELEDISKLPAHERSRGVLRNAIKKHKGIQ